MPSLEVDRAAIRAHLALLFAWVDWSDPDYADCGIAIRGVGEKDTPAAGKPAESIFLPVGAAAASDATEDATLEALARVVADHATRWAANDFAAYIVPAVMRDGANAGESSVIAFSTICVDIDDGDTTMMLARAESALGPASMVIHSGGQTKARKQKIHAYWRLTELAAGDDVRRVASARHKLALAIGGDVSFQRLPQVIRIAGSIHGKGGKKRPVIVIEDRPAAYDLSDLESTIDDLLSASGAKAPDTEGGLLSFLPTESMQSVLTTDVHEGGVDRTRFENVSRVIGYELHLVRAQKQSLLAAWQAVQGYNATHVMPAWPEDRLQREFEALVRVAVKQDGPFPDTATDAGGWSLPNIQPHSIAPFHGRARPWELEQWRIGVWAKGKAPERKFLVDRLLLAGKKHLLVAEGGAGKSIAVLDLALSVAAAPDVPDLKWMGEPVRRGGNVVVLMAEDDLDELHLRLEILDPDGNRRSAAADRLTVIPLDDAGGSFPFVHPNRSGESVPTQSWLRTREAILKVPDLRLVVVDTLNATMSGEENSAGVIGDYYRAIGPLCSATGAALLVTHHMRKQPEPIRSPQDAHDAIRGSVALPAANRAVITIWAAHDYEKRAAMINQHHPALSIPVRPKVLWYAAVTKANNPDMAFEPKLLLRTKTGLLQDITAFDPTFQPEFQEALAWLVVACWEGVERQAAFIDAPPRAPGSIYARKYQLPPKLQSMADRDATMRHLIDTARKDGLLVTAAVAIPRVRPGTPASHRSGLYPGHIKDPLTAPGRGSAERWADWKPDWDGFVFDKASGRVIRPYRAPAREPGEDEEVMNFAPEPRLSRD